MARKKLVTQELVNKFPDWADVRRDEQSVGHSLINVLATGLENLVEESYRGHHNRFLTTANVSEIDQVYVHQLPNNFLFNVDDPNQLVPLEVSPTVSGLIDGEWYLLDEVDEGNIKDFWYQAVATRISIGETTLSGIQYDQAVLDAYTSDHSWQLDQELQIPNRLLVRVTEGAEFFFEEKNEIRRARVRITGVTWKDTNETEELVFLFNEDQLTNKVWKEITSIEAIDFREAARVEVFLLDAGVGHYFDPYQDQHQYVESRNTMSRFWDVQTTPSGIQLLVAEKFAGSTVDDLLANQSSKVEYRSWELVDENDVPLDILDIEPIPYGRMAYAVTASGLHVYDLDIDVPSVSLTKDKTPAGLVRIETSNDYPIRDEDVGVDFLFQRPIKTIFRHRLRITYPDGAEFGVLSDGSLVATTTDYWVQDTTDSRFIRPTTFFQFTDYGYHILTFETEYADGSLETAQRVITVERKQPLASFSLSEIPWDIQSVAMDHLHKLYVVDINGMAHRIEPHYDVILIDYQNKEVICREPYDMVKVLK
jgi:hypothetical protein